MKICDRLIIQINKIIIILTEEVKMVKCSHFRF